MKYCKQIADKVVALYATGDQSVQAICNAVKIERTTFYLWKSNNASFRKRIEEAEITRLESIGDLAMSAMKILLEKHEYEETTIDYEPDKNGKPKIKSQKTVKKFIMPNPAMVALALTNRKAKDWKNKQSVDLEANITGTVVKVGYGSKDEDAQV